VEFWIVQFHIKKTKIKGGKIKTKKELVTWVVGVPRVHS